jgi:predicted glycosyltransferase
MKDKGHEILVVSRNKEIEFKLLEYYKIPFFKRGQGGNSKLGRFFYMLKADFIILKKALKFKPDLFLSFLHPYPAHIAFLLRKPHIAFSDTDHARLHHKMTIPFSKAILTPDCYPIDLGKKHIRFNGYMELCYLHPNWFKPDNSIYKLLNISEGEKYVIVRFVSWKAVHDAGFKGLEFDFKVELIKTISKYSKVFISSEAELPDELKTFQIEVPVYKMHDVLANATLFIGEGATMASECAVLGTPAIYINPLKLCYCEEEEKKYNLIFNFRDKNGVIEKTNELLSQNNLKPEFQKKRDIMLNDKIDTTGFMIWFIENWPNSKLLMQQKNSPFSQKNS